jgi:hypothetical protein
MLFTPESVLEARRRLMKQMEAGTITQEQCFEQALQLDPFDAMALTVLGQAHYSAGDRPAAEEKFWRAVTADPSRCEAWFGLERCLADRGPSQALRNGVLLLAARKMLRSEESIEEFIERLKQRPEAAILPPGRTGVEVLIAVLARATIGEPAEVTALLRPHRLIDELLESAMDGLDPELVDQIVAEGVRSVPLLIGVLRAMATRMLPPNDPSQAAASVALLGEIGDPAAAPEIIEFCSVHDEFEDFIMAAAEWAVLRLAARRPDETYQALHQMAAHATQRSAIASLLARMPARPDRLDFAVSLLDGIDALPKSDRQDLFLNVADTILMIEGQRGKRLVRSLFERYARLLPRGTESDLREVEALNDVVNAVRREPGSEEPESTVYDYCSGFEDDDEDDEDEDEEDDDDHEDVDRFIPATIKRSATPGRNDPCWCGSGKKYKKCHLSAPS